MFNRFVMQSGAAEGPEEGDGAICSDTLADNNPVIRIAAITATLVIVLRVCVREDLCIKPCKRSNAIL